MPPPEEKSLPRPKPKPKPPKPKKAPEQEQEKEEEPKPMPARPEPRRDGTPGGDPVVSSCADSCSGPCAFLLPHCQPPPPTTTLKLRSSHLPTPLIAVSASLLAFLAVLLLALLVRCLVRRRRRRRMRNGPLGQHGEEGLQQQQVLAGAVAGEAGVLDEEEDGGVHHVWYIRTKGLDERAIAAIAAVVYDAKKRGVGGGSCAVCLAEFRDGETLRLLPRCAHAFHRGCIDTWLRAHVNCPLCRAPVQAPAPAAPPRGGGEAAEPAPAPAGLVIRAEEEEAAAAPDERAVRRAASMVALPPRRAWPDVSFRAPTSSSGREGDMGGLGKIVRLLKLSDSSLEASGIGAGRPASFGGAPTRPGPSAADEVSSQ